MKAIELAKKILEALGSENTTEEKEAALRIAIEVVGLEYLTNLDLE